MKKFGSYLALLLATLVLLTACTSNTDNEKSSQSSSSQSNKDEVVENHASVENYELSEALPKYEIWYVFEVIDNKMIQKDTEPEYLLYFDGKNVETYRLDYDDDLMSMKDIERLPISKLLDKSKEEQLEYAQSFLKVTTIQDTGDGVNLTATNSPEAPKSPYSINIISDGSGNNTAAEIIKAKYNNVKMWPNGDEDSYEWNLIDKDFDVKPNVETAQIYDHTLSGFKVGDNNWVTYRILTNIQDDRVNFVLDTPQTKSEFITIDEED